jgi:phosphatidylserine/phosphatidylglycerophosphate/cardiolipin synthase-like enzyme
MRYKSGVPHTRRHSTKPSWVSATVLLALVMFASDVNAQEVVCDTSVENCRDVQPGKTTLIQLIRTEAIGIDVGMWFIKDDRYRTELIKKFQAGVPVRIIMDPRANSTYPTNAAILDAFKTAGIPMRKRIAGDICHWKLMIFQGQGVVEWSGANFSPIAFRPDDPYRNYEDEIIHFSRELFPSFATMFDNIWLNTVQYADYANIVRPLVRKHPIVPIDKRLNFPPTNSYQDRLIPLIDAENVLIDVQMYRITMSRPVSALIRAAARGVRIRMYLDPKEYANTARPGNKVQMDRLVAAAQQYPGTIEIRMRKHYGLNHQKTVWLHSSRIVIFGTSNWSDASDDNQLEANFFGDVDPQTDHLNESLFAETHSIFERKFYNENPIGAQETVAWRTPSLPRPNVSGTCNDTSAQNYGSALPCAFPPPPTICEDPGALNHGGSLPCEYTPSTATTIVLYAKDVPAIIGTRWIKSDTSVQPQVTGAADGLSLWNPNQSNSKIATGGTAVQNPANYFEFTFTAEPRTPYHLWIRMKAENDYYGNDSVHVQFSDSVSESGTPVYRINSTSTAEVVLQEIDGGSSLNWGWADNGWNGNGPHIYFANGGTHRIRVQQREDGVLIDQIVLSPSTYLNAAPGQQTNDATVVR